MRGINAGHKRAAEGFRNPPCILSPCWEAGRAHSSGAGSCGIRHGNFCSGRSSGLSAPSMSVPGPDSFFIGTIDPAEGHRLANSLRRVRSRPQRMESTPSPPGPPHERLHPAIPRRSGFTPQSERNGDTAGVRSVLRRLVSRIGADEVLLRRVARPQPQALKANKAGGVVLIVAARHSFH